MSIHDQDALGHDTHVDIEDWRRYDDRDAYQARLAAEILTDLTAPSSAW